MRDIKKLCITGGPCGGKTTSLAYVLQKLSERGFEPLIVPEAATLMLSGNVVPANAGGLAFQTAVMRTARSLEATFCSHAGALVRHGYRPVIITDRGLCDSAAYVPREVYLAALKGAGIESEVAARDKSYDAVFHLVTAADGAERFYTNENNSVRLETPEEARMLDARTQQAWIGHPHLRVIDNSTDFAGKLAKLDREICSALGIPVPLEIEKKFECDPVDLSTLPAGAQHIEIEQVYLMSAEDVVTRVRKRGQNGAFTYYHTVKRDVSPGARSEVEQLIDEKEYAWSLQFRHPDTKPIVKTRICFLYENQYFELDIIPRDTGTMYLLEIELTEINQSITLPPFIKVRRDVTEDPAFTNRALAEAA